MSAILKAHSDITGMSRVRFVVAVFVVALSATTSFAAGDAPALTAEQNAKKATRTPYQAYLAADCLGSSNFCKFASVDVPNNATLEIHRVACQGWHTSTELPSFVVMAELRTAADAFVRRIDFLKTSYAPANGGSVWAISEQSLMFIPAGHRLRINLNSGTVGVGSYGCTISGYLTTN
jgi:hypothetical protein